MSAAGVQQLPVEVLVQILAQPALSCRDVHNAALACSKFAAALQCNALWKRLFENRFTTVYNVYFKQRWHIRPPFGASLSQCDWRRMLRTHIQLDRQLRTLLENEVQPGYLHRQTATVLYSYFDRWIRVFAAEILNDPTELTPIFAILVGIMHEQPWNMNLTMKFYARQCFDRLTPILWSEKILNADSLEDAVWLLSKWLGLSPENDTFIARGSEQLSQCLDEAAHHVLLVLQHSDKAIADKIALLPHNQDFDWPGSSAQSIVRAILQVMCTLNLKGDCEDDSDIRPHRLCPLRSLLNQSAARPISLCIILILLAKRLKLSIQPVNMPNRFLVRFKISGNGDGAVWTYVDAWRQAVMTEVEVIRWHTANIGGGAQQLDLSTSRIGRLNFAASSQIIERIVNNVLTADFDYSPNERLFMRATEFLLQLHEWRSATQRATPHPHGGRAGWRIKRELAGWYINGGTNLDRVESMLAPLRRDTSGGCPFMSSVRDVAMQLPSIRRGFGGDDVVSNATPLHQKLRQPGVLFSVGMVMRHKRYDYRCVIYGWDPVCGAGLEWQQRMNVQSLPDGAQQPFYNVHAGDGSSRYAAQENLEPVLLTLTEAELLPIRHGHVLKYFESYHGDRYKMNDSCLNDYPEDWNACQTFLAELYEKKNITQPVLLKWVG